MGSSCSRMWNCHTRPPPLPWGRVPNRAHCTCKTTAARSTIAISGSCLGSPEFQRVGGTLARCAVRTARPHARRKATPERSRSQGTPLVIPIRVEFYGIVRLRAGAAGCELDAAADGLCLGEVLRRLERRFPALAGECLHDGRLRRLLGQPGRTHVCHRSGNAARARPGRVDPLLRCGRLV